MSMMHFDAGNDGCRPPASAAGAATRAGHPRQAARSFRRSRNWSPRSTIVPAFSPIVVAGIVRMIEFGLIALVGVVDLFRLCLSRLRRVRLVLRRRPRSASPALAMIAFQAADIYHVQAFRSPVGQCARLTVAWSLVFLSLVALVFFAQLGGMYSRVWLGELLTASACSRSTRSRLFVFGWCAAGPARAGSTAAPSWSAAATPGEHLVTALDASDGFRRAPRRRVRRPRRRSRADRLRRPPEARHGRRPRRVRAPHPRRSRDLLAADLGREPHPADAEEALGAAGRYPPLGAHQQAALPPALLFLHRQRAGARRVRPADRRLGRRDEMAVRQARRRPRADRGPARDGDRRACDQARQPRPGALQAEALRLQQRADRGLTSSARCMSTDRRNRREARHQGRSARHARRPLHPQDLARRAAAALQRGVQGQPLARRPAPARGARQGGRPALRRGGRRLFRAPPRQARHHRLGADQRLARRNRHRREDPAPRRARPLLHRELVGAVRPLHPGDDAVRAAKTENAY